MTRLPSSGRRFARAAITVVLAGLLAGCDTQWLTDFLGWLGMAPETHKRISGESYFKIDKGEKEDGAYSQNGYLCVVHYPGCGASGEDGEDSFFSIRQLPPLVTLESFEFTPVPPPGLSAENPGDAFGTGSFDTKLQPGTADGQATVRVRWHNTCVGQYGGKAAVYRVSLKIKVKGDPELIDTPYDQNQSLPIPACRFDNPNGGTGTGTSETSGWFGSIYVCNPFDVNNKLHLKATFSGSGGTAGATTLDEDIPITFKQQTGGSWSADFRTQQNYRKGNWTITSVSLDGNFGSPPSIPRTQALPGGLGEPVFDFRGGACVPN